MIPSFGVTPFWFQRLSCAPLYTVYYLWYQLRSQLTTLLFVSSLNLAFSSRLPQCFLYSVTVQLSCYMSIAKHNTFITTSDHYNGDGADNFRFSLLSDNPSTSVLTLMMLTQFSCFITIWKQQMHVITTISTVMHGIITTVPGMEERPLAIRFISNFH